MSPPRRIGTWGDLVSGRSTGWQASLLRGLLRLAEGPYTWAVTRRNERYDAGRARVERVAVPVISVGNLTTGGTGKTPLVAWLAGWLEDHGYRAVLISRGYKAAGGQPNDEARELRRARPDVPHIQQADRVAAARRAIAQYGAQVLLLDDAFQHRRLHRDLDIVLLDALQPFGHGHLLPRGLLREPLSGLVRAHIVGLSRADAVEAGTRGALQAEVGRLAPRSRWIELAHRPHQLVNAAGGTRPVESLAGRSIAAFCGIGNPAAFRLSLERLGYRVAAFQPFPDHCAFGPRELAALQRWLAREQRVEAVVCTGKDLVKLAVGQISSIPLWALTITIDVTQGRSELESALHRVLDSAAE
ncbi:MAG: tetraacyldisaccharide 4'-kinase [Pirellulaceae bacterium]|nr:tetraacyldisaccharide 4'-kinase [Pirellulaceae bacterium]